MARNTKPSIIIVDKTCIRCQRSLPLDEFHRNRCKRDGRNSYCKPCQIKSVLETIDPQRVKRYGDAYREQNKAAIAVKAKARRLADPVKFNAQRKVRYQNKHPPRVKLRFTPEQQKYIDQLRAQIYYWKHWERRNTPEVKAAKHAYYLANIEHHREYMRDYYARNRAMLQQYSREYIEANRETINREQRERYHRRKAKKAKEAECQATQGQVSAAGQSGTHRRMEPTDVHPPA